MFEQAAGFALLASISPSALFVMAVFLASAEPRRTALAYVTGALVMTVAMAVAVLFIIRASGLDQPRESEPRGRRDRGEPQRHAVIESRLPHASGRPRA